MASVRERVGARATIGTALVAVVPSVAIGILDISPPVVGSMLAPYIPDATRVTTGFARTLTGFLFLASVFGFRRRYRAAWYSTAMMLPVTATQGLIQSPKRATPLVELSLISLALLVFNHRAFDRDLDLTATQLSALFAITGAQTYTTAGVWTLREQFSGIDTLFSALYSGVATGGTVGYGDIYPQTAIVRLFGISAFLITVTTFVVVLDVLLTPAIEAQLTKALGRMTRSQLDIPEDHVFILDYEKPTESTLKGLGDRARAVIVTPDEGRTRRLTDRGYDVVTNDLSDEETLQQIHVDVARLVVITTNNDIEDALVILTARQLNPDVHIVAAMIQQENKRKLCHAGASTVTSLAVLDGHFLVESAAGGSDLETIEERLFGEQPAEPAKNGTGEVDDSGTDGRN